MVESHVLIEPLQFLNAAEVDYLIVGGYAVSKYTEPRFTKDLDVWVGTGAKNAVRVYQALAQFGAPLEADGITSETFAEPDVVYQLGVAPVRIDILTTITAVEFTHAWKNRVKSSLYGVPVYFLSLEDLIANKEAMGRGSDVEDLKKVRK